MGKDDQRRIHLVSMGLLIVLAVFGLSRGMNKLFVGHHDFNSNLWMQTAKNNLKYGIGCTKLGQATTYYPTDCEHLTYYMNHPPLISWLETVSYGIFGLYEWAGRLPIVLISTGSVVLMYLLGVSLFNPLVGLTAGLLMLATPMFLYFGKAINHEPLVLFGVLWAVYGYVKWIGSDSSKQKNSRVTKKWLGIFIASSVYTGLAGWHGYLVYPLLWLHLLVTRRWKKLVGAIVPIAILVAIYFLHRWHTCTIGDCSYSLFNKFLERAGATVTDQSVQYTLFGLVYKLLVWVKAFYSLILMGLTSVYMMGLAAKVMVEKRLRMGNQMILMLLLYGLSIPAVFSEQAFIHDYLLIYLLPFMVLGSAVVAEKVIGPVAKYVVETKKLPNEVNKQVVAGGLSLVLMGSVVWQTNAFRVALQTSSFALPYYQMAQLINSLKKQNSETNVVIEARGYYELGYQYITNYSYGTHHTSRSDTLDKFMKDQKELEKDYTDLITVATNPVEQPLIDYLNSTYTHHGYGDLTVYVLP